MGPTARIESVEVLQTFRDALAEFGVAAQGALGSAASEIQHTLDELRDRLSWWQAQVNRRQEEVGRAKADLAQKRWSTDKGVGRGTTEQEIALEKAKRALREAEAKVETIRRWQRLLPEAIKEYEGPARQLGGMVDTNLRHSLAILDTRIEALEAYTTLAAPAQSGSSTTPAQPASESPAPTATSPEGGTE
jgi:chromosome segregation ATPase